MSTVILAALGAVELAAVGVLVHAVLDSLRDDFLRDRRRRRR